MPYDKTKKAARDRAYQLANRERVAANARRWYQANKERMAAASLDRYRNNKEHYKATRAIYYEKNKHNTAAKKRSFRDQIDGIKLSAGCVDCGYREHPAALDFDHLDHTTKRTEVSSCASMETALAEIAKCEVRCSNCHRIKTFNERKTKKIQILTPRP